MNKANSRNIKLPQENTIMPYIKIESGKLSDEQKTLLIKRITEISAEIMNIPQEFFVTNYGIAR